MKASFRDTLLLAVWLGLFTGIIEATVYALLAFGLGERVGVSLDFPWMTPVADLAVLATAGLFVAIPAAIWPVRLTTPRVVGILTFIAACALLLLAPRLHSYARLLIALGVAVQAGRLAAAHPEGLRRMVATSAPVLAAVVVLAAVGLATARDWREQRTTERLARAPGGASNVLLLILDTVRAQSLGLYGYERSTTPNLARLANDGIIFERAIATAPWTLTSHASIFTGRYPHELAADWEVPLPDSVLTLAEVLRENGWATGGFAANLFYTTWESGLDQGFVHYESHRVSLGQIALSSAVGRRLARVPPLRDVFGYYDNLNRRPAASVNHSFLAWLDERPQPERPFFAFLNYFDAHEPYLPAAPYADRFGTADVRRNEWIRFSPPLNIGYRSWKNRMTPAEHQAEVDAYDATIASMDRELGVLLEGLRRRAALDNTVIIVTSDHGEQFGEHGLYSHANSLYLPLLHVPLVIHVPADVSCRRVARPVSLRDLPATILALAGLGPSGLPGSDLSDLWTAGNATSSPILSGVSARRDMRPRVSMASLMRDSLHLITYADGRIELYDIVDDRGQIRDLAGQPGSTNTIGELVRAMPASMPGRPADQVAASAVKPR